MPITATRRARLVLALLSALVVALLVGQVPGAPAVSASVDGAGPATGADGVATPGAVSVRDPAYGLTGDVSVDGDATAAFAAAMRDALRSPVRYADGPTGPQAVVAVPAGSYGLGGLVVPSDVRLEVDADAVLVPERAAPASAAAVTAGAVAKPVHMLLLGDHSATPVTNVSVVAVGRGSASAGLKARAQPTYDGWDIGGYFTVDLDAAGSAAPSDYGFAALINVRGFDISGVYVVQNDTIPSCTAQSDPSCPVASSVYPAPTTGRAAIAYKPAQATGLTGPFYDPTDGRLSGVYSVGAPFGFGPTQIAAGHDLDFADLYSEGGTTLRLETDDAAPKRYRGELADVRAHHVVGVRCNRALSLAAHKQDNHAVAVSDVTAVDCAAGMVESTTKRMGSFTASTVDGLRVVGGAGAQVSPTNDASWVVGTSEQPVDDTVPGNRWTVAVTGLSCTGTFTTAVFDRVLIDGVLRRPACVSG